MSLLRSISALLVLLFGWTAVEASGQTNTRGATLELIDCDVDAKSLANRVELESGQEIFLDRERAASTVEVRCQSNLAIISLDGVGKEAMMRRVSIAGADAAALDRLLAVAIVELWDSALSDVGLLESTETRPESAPAGPEQVELATTDSPSVTPENVGPEWALSVAAGATSSDTPLDVYPTFLANLSWRSDSPVGLSTSVALDFRERESDLGRISILGVSAAAAMTYGHEDLAGPAAELGGRATISILEGLSDEPNVLTSSATHISGGPFAAGVWHLGLSSTFLLYARLEAGFDFARADANEDAASVVRTGGFWALIGFGGGFYF